jgi:hypothetical protein
MNIRSRVRVRGLVMGPCDPGPLGPKAIAGNC